MVEEDNTPLSVTITPCDAPLEWKLTLQELPEEASGEGSGKGQQHMCSDDLQHILKNGLLLIDSTCLYCVICFMVDFLLM